MRPTHLLPSIAGGLLVAALVLAVALIAQQSLLDASRSALGAGGSWLLVTWAARHWLARRDRRRRDTEH